MLYETKIQSVGVFVHLMDYRSFICIITVTIHNFNIIVFLLIYCAFCSTTVSAGQ